MLADEDAMLKYITSYASLWTCNTYDLKQAENKINIP